MEAAVSEQPENFARLREEHAKLEQLLGQLQAKPYLSDDEQIEETRLKKRKLYVKDRLSGIVPAGNAA